MRDVVPGRGCRKKSEERMKERAEPNSNSKMLYRKVRKYRGERERERERERETAEIWRHRLNHSKQGNTWTAAKRERTNRRPIRSAAAAVAEEDKGTMRKRGGHKSINRYKARTDTGCCRH